MILAWNVPPVTVVTKQVGSKEDTSLYSTIFKIVTDIKDDFAFNLIYLVVDDLAGCDGAVTCCDKLDDKLTKN